MRNLLLLLSAMFLFTGCQKIGNDTKKESLNSKQETKSADTLSYESKQYKKRYKDCNENDEKCSYLNISYMEFKGNAGPEINKVLNAFITDSLFNIEEKPNKTLEGLTTAFFKDYEEVMKTSSADFPVTYALDVKSNVVLNKPKALSVSVEEYINTGGAHPNTYIKYFVFNPQSGKQLTLNDIFTTGFEGKLNKLIDAKYRADKGLKPGDKLSGEKGELFEDFIRYNNNFILTKDGIEFLYNRYEIAAYVFGEITVKFTYKELEEILKQEYK